MPLPGSAPKEWEEAFERSVRGTGITMADFATLLGMRINAVDMYRYPLRQPRPPVHFATATNKNAEIFTGWHVTDLDGIKRIFRDMKFRGVP